MARNSISIDITGVDKTVKKLFQTKKTLERLAEEKTIRILKRAQEIARAYCPVSEFGAIPGGTLRNSIQYRYDKKTRTGYLYTDSPVAPFVEYGTGIKGKTGKQNPEVPAGWKQNTGQTIIVLADGRVGWFFPTTGEDGKKIYKFTEGIQASPFMYHAYKYMKEQTGR